MCKGKLASPHLSNSKLCGASMSEEGSSKDGNMCMQKWEWSQLYFFPSNNGCLYSIGIRELQSEVM